MSETSFVLTLTSDPLPGIIAAVSTAVADLGGNIAETNQHWDRPTNRFFLRVAFLGPEGLTVPAVEQALAPTVEKLGLDLKVTDAAPPAEDHRHGLEVRPRAPAPALPDPRRLAARRGRRDRLEP